MTGTVIAAAVLAAVIGVAVRKIIKDRKRGSGCPGCGCSGGDCPGCRK